MKKATCAISMIAAMILAVVAANLPASTAEPLAIFHVGNSLTDQSYGMHDIAKARGHTTKFGRHMIAGAPLDWLWNHRSEGFLEPTKTPADELLRNNKWDMLILQPFSHSIEEETDAGIKYAAEAYKGNPNCRVYVFASYPEVGKKHEFADEWEKRWLSETERRGRAKFEKVAAGITAKFPDRLPVRIIPVGEVMYQLHQRMKEGKVPGFKHIAELFEDETHLKAEGKYMEAVTHYATVFGEDPHGVITSGLRFWKGPYSVDPKFAAAVWDVAWEVVRTYPQSGVKINAP